MIILILGFFLIVALCMLLVMFTEMLNFIQTRVPFVPTAKADLVDLVDRAGITANDVVYDLGSGNGKVMFVIEELTNARTKGFQRSGWTQWYAQLKKRFTNSKVELVTGSFFDHSWSGATVVYAYLYPFLMQSVSEKAWIDCKPGTRIIIRDFYLPDREPQEKWSTPTGHTMYLYLVS